MSPFGPISSFSQKIFTPQKNFPFSSPQNFFAQNFFALNFSIFFEIGPGEHVSIWPDLKLFSKNFDWEKRVGNLISCKKEIVIIKAFI